MPAARKRLKSMYSTTASSVGRRLNMAAEERARDRYQIAPQRVRPQSAKISRMSSQARVLGVTNRVSHSREFRGARFRPQPEVRLQLAHHAREIGQREGLRTVADGLLRTRMDLHDQSVGANRHRGAGERGNQAALARGVARVENHRQVRKLIQHRYGRDIASVARRRLEGPYAALAQNHVGVAVGHNVLGGHEQFLDSGTHAALEQHRTAAAAERFQQREILHIARAYLHAVGVLRHQFHIAIAHDLGDDAQPGALLGLAEQFQPFQFQALKVVGRRPRLEGAAAQDPRAGRRHTLGRVHNLLFALHRARAGHHYELVRADFTSVDFDRRPALAELLADEFVRGGDAHGALHSWRGFERFQADGHIPNPHHANNYPLFALDGMHLVPKFRDALAHVVDFFSSGMGPHGNNHKTQYTPTDVKKSN